MATKPDTEARALLNAVCDWLTQDAGFMPAYVERLRARFEAAMTSRDMSQRDKSGGKEDRRSL